MRACAAVNTKVVKRLYIWSSIGFLIRSMIPQFLGICALVYFANHAAGNAYFLDLDALSETEKTARTMLAMPVFLGQILPAGLIGLVGAGMLAAFMSTHDSYLLCWSSVLTQDVVAPCMASSMSTRARITLTRVFIAVIGVFLLVWSLWYPLGQDLWDYMAVTGAIYFSGALALLSFGIYWKRASTTGAYLSLIAGSFALLGLKPVKNALGIELSTEAIGLSAIALCLVCMLVGSLVFPDSKPQRGSPVKTALDPAADQANGSEA